jgi:hypothetical protein
MPAIKQPASATLPAEYRCLQKRLSQSGWIALGTVLERNKPGGGGPRYQWSRRVEGKTITVALSKEQFLWLKAAIANQRELSKTLERMHRLTLAHMWKHLPSAARRKSLSNKTLGLN